METVEPESIKVHTSMPSTIAKIIEETESSGCESFLSGINWGESIWGCETVADVCPSTAANGSFPDGWSQSVDVFQET